MLERKLCRFSLLILLAANQQLERAAQVDLALVVDVELFDGDGTINSDAFRHSLMTWGEKFTAQEVDEAYEQFDIDDEGKIDMAGVLELLVGGKKEEETEAAA